LWIPKIINLIVNSQKALHCTVCRRDRPVHSPLCPFIRAELSIHPKTPQKLLTTAFWPINSQPTRYTRRLSAYVKLKNTLHDKQVCFYWKWRTAVAKRAVRTDRHGTVERGSAGFHRTAVLVTAPVRTECRSGGVSGRDQ